MSSSNNVNYVNNVDFHSLLIFYNQNNDRKTYELLGKIFIKIAEGILKRPNFINYSYDRKNEMISDATFYMVKYMKNYDITRNNPFAWFSQIAFNAFIQFINKQNNKEKMFVPLSYLENISNKGNNQLVTADVI